LTQSQDKSLRRISELKEQVQLDYQAKKDLENNYQLMLDEKDEVIQVLRTQVSGFYSHESLDRFKNSFVLIL